MKNKIGKVYLFPCFLLSLHPKVEVTYSIMRNEK